MLRRLSAVLAVAAAFFAVPAVAASLAVATNDLNIRTGPAAHYQRWGTIPAGDRVRVFGCLRGYNWCDVVWRGDRGWVHGAYLASLGQGYARQAIPQVAVQIGVPVYGGFDPYDYHRRHYAGRSWYHDRYLGDRRAPGFDGPPPPPRRFDRDEDYAPDRDYYPDRGDRDYGRRDAYREERRVPPPPPPGGFDRNDGFGPDRDFRDPDRFDPRRRPPPPLVGDDGF